MTLDWWTLGLQAFNFLILVGILWRFLYRPVMGVIERRREEAMRAFSEAAEAKRQALAEATLYRTKTDDIARERREALEAARTMAEAERTSLQADTRREAERLLEGARETIASERMAALGEIRDRAADLAVAIAGTLLQNAVARPVEEVFLEHLCQRLAMMPEPDRQRLMGTGGAPVEVAVETASPLDEASRMAVAGRLRPHLGSHAAFRFREDAGLIAGIRLRFSSADLEASWRAALGDARKEMTTHGVA